MKKSGFDAALKTFNPTFSSRTETTLTRHMGFGMPDDDRPRRTVENEPEEYFQSPTDKLPLSERFKDPIVLLGLGGVLFPFFLLAFFYAAGLIGN
eukprot:CAMPEP_0113934200 /NCGR_PEP_ID=MMETSP1339-20121228/1538_1 /TAXON_ID=94617 /ORGANISM="Fibrocapsa japonica" /LENGTH=94 /DNA_ID=CAMNT_0000935897 /DNA_START=187 /DNA_END=471 /DNA_ORIENTATION=+ /assembly_acc=CAM_ASM_000762